MSTRTRWTFVGAGNMASSLVGGLLEAGVPVTDIHLVDPDDAARRKASARFGVQAFETVDGVPVPADGTRQGVVIAVKPDIVERACRAITAQADAVTARGGDTIAPPLVVSVAAGVRLDAFTRWLPDGTALCRCMPNTPSLLGLGATGLFADAACPEVDIRRAEALLGTSGYVVRVAEERLLDAVTATSGSGPAYVFQLVEHMAAAGAALGLDADVARELAIETAFGAASMLRAREVPPDELRRRVTSPNGTTAAALAAFADAGFGTLVHDAMRAAHDRAVELGDELAGDADH